MCNVGKFLSRAFTFGNTARAQQTAALQQQTSAITQQTQATQQAAEEAAARDAAALSRAEAASVPIRDSESARRSAEDRMRRLLATSTGVNTGLPRFGSAPVGYRMLQGQ